MAFVNLPANLQDIFGSITDRIAKLETGPNQAMYTAVDASAQATISLQAANEANAAAAQATYEAGIAVASANGKNTTHYSTSGPSGGGVNGDIWFQVNGSTGVVLYQYIYNSGSWNNSPISNTVIANLDAGKITAGTITGIAYYNGSGTFSVSPTGVLVATSATITGVINGGTGYIGGWFFNSNGIYNSGSDNLLYANPGTDGLAYSTTGRGIMRRLQLNGSSGTTLGSATLAVGGILTVDSDSTLAGNIRSVGTTNTTTGSAANVFINSVSGLFARSTASSQRYKHDIVNLTDVPELDPKALYKLPVRAFRFNKDYLPIEDDRADVLVPGFIAEEMDAVYPLAVDYNDGQVETWNDRMLVPALLSLIQDLNNRVKILENK